MKKGFGSVSQRCWSESAPKCHGSPTLIRSALWGSADRRWKTGSTGVLWTLYSLTGLYINLPPPKRGSTNAALIKLYVFLSDCSKLASARCRSLYHLVLTYFVECLLARGWYLPCKSSLVSCWLLVSSMQLASALFCCSNSWNTQNTAVGKIPEIVK